MATFTRRAFVAGGLAAGVAIPGAAADTEPDPEIEFDKKAHQNPKGVGGGKVSGTGVVRPPAGHTVEEIVIECQRIGANPQGWTMVKATVDGTKSPPAWSFTVENLEAGDHWFQVRVTFATPDGKRVAYDGWDRRRVVVK